VRDEGRTVFLSSHVLSEVQRVADEVIVLRAGRVVATGSVEELRHAARQRFTAWFAALPPVGELRATPGVTDVEVRGNEASGIIEGPPKALLATLARHEVVHLLLPEPDLEDAFLRFYAKDEPAEDDAGAAGTHGTAT
jgi:ABC-2 type transport system ATP-binding protein